MPDIVGPEIVFCNEHILIIYPKTTFIKAKEEDISLDEDFFEDEVSKQEKSPVILD